MVRATLVVEPVMSGGSRLSARARARCLAPVDCRTGCAGTSGAGICRPIATPALQSTIALVCGPGPRQGQTWSFAGVAGMDQAVCSTVPDPVGGAPQGWVCSLTIEGPSGQLTETTTTFDCSNGCSPSDIGDCACIDGDCPAQAAASP
jgi:hypothetical protein